MSHPPQSNHASPSVRILVVEDDEDVADVLSEVLRCAGHKVEVAGTADEALVQVEAFQPELAIIDIGLPDLDGYELARRIRARAQCRLFALSGFSATTAPSETAVTSFDAHFMKPVDISVLLRAFAGPA